MAGITLEDIEFDNFKNKVTYASDTTPGNKLVIDDGMFVQCLIHLKLIDTIDKFRISLRK